MRLTLPPRFILLFDYTHEIFADEIKMTNEWTFLQTKTFGVEWLGIWVFRKLFFRNRHKLAIFLSESLQVFVSAFHLTSFTVFLNGSLQVFVITFALTFFTVFFTLSILNTNH